MRTAPRRNLLIAACVFGVVIVVGLVAERRHAAQISAAEDRAKLPAEQLGILEDATKGPSAPPSTPAQGAAPASGADSTAPKRVVIAVVRPWVDIARMPAYVRASTAERKAIRDLYWRTCVEDRIPLEQRTVAYAQFVHKWASHEAGEPESPAPTSSPELLREQQARVPSPVDAATMREWCSR